MLEYLEYLASLWQRVPSTVKKQAAEAAAKHVADRMSGRAAKRDRNERIEQLESKVTRLTQEITESHKHIELVHSQLSRQVSRYEEEVLKLQNQNHDTDKQVTTLEKQLSELVSMTRDTDKEVTSLEKQLNGLTSVVKIWGTLLSSAVLIVIALLIWLLVRVL